MASGLTRYAVVLLTAALWASAACAEDTNSSTTQAATQPDSALTLESFAPVATAPPGSLALPDIWPDLSWTTLCWFGAVVILALTIRIKPLLWVRNLDALVLAGMCVLLALRDMPGHPTGSIHTWQSWAILGLTAAVAYWLLRGIALLAGRRPMRHPGTVSAGVRLVLVLAGLTVSIHQLATAPISAGSRDGIVGGLYTAVTGKLPYGDAAGFENRSPLLYLVHAGAIRAVEPTLPDPTEQNIDRPMRWTNREWWLAQPWVESAELTPARLVNAALFVLLVLGLYVLGSRLQREGTGWSLVAMLCVFPGAIECLPRPEVMLPTVLLTWTAALALVPGIGSLLATLCLVLAGLAWPWAWLGMPVLLAYFWRRGWHALGGTVGLLGGVALCVAGLLALVQPAMPYSDGALAIAAEQPSYTARLADRDTIVLDRLATTQPATQWQALSRWFWQRLLASEAVPLKRAESGGAALKIDWPNGVSGEGVLFEQVDPTPQARPMLQTAYRSALKTAPGLTRALVATRTVLEATWLRVGAVAPLTSCVWETWSGSSVISDRWILIHRIVKAVVVLLVIWVVLAIFLGRRTRPRHLLAGLLVTISGATLASQAGATANLIWLLPLVAVLWAVYEPTEEIARPAHVPSAAALDLGPTPRITVEPQPPAPPR